MALVGAVSLIGITMLVSPSFRQGCLVFAQSILRLAFMGLFTTLVVWVVGYIILKLIFLVSDRVNGFFSQMDLALKKADVLERTIVSNHSELQIEIRKLLANDKLLYGKIKELDERLRKLEPVPIEAQNTIDKVAEDITGEDISGDAS